MEAFSSPDPRWLQYVFIAQDLAQFLQGTDTAPAGPNNLVPTPRQAQEFGRLVRDRRDAAGYSRVQLAQRTKLSDATIKFAETARHPPSRATLIRLIALPELGLTWADVPWMAAHARPTEALAAAEADASSDDSLNCYITPGSDPVRMVMDLGRFLNGAGGHVEQTNAYLDHQSAAAYLAIFQQSPSNVAIRGAMPLSALAKHIVKATAPDGLNVIALGAGDAALEVRLTQHLVEEQNRPDVRLCLFDVSQPLLSAGFKLATDTLNETPGVTVWAIQGNFHHLPLYTQLHGLASGIPRRRRVYCMLGNTLANIDNEPRFFQHSLVDCAPGDLIVLDVHLAHGSSENPDEIRRQDPGLRAPLPKVFADFLAGPIYRHCKDVTGVEFSVNLDTQCPMPGSYALDAVATVKSNGKPDRRFSMFRFKRHDPEKLAQCLERLDWELLVRLPSGTAADRPGMVMVFRKA